MKTFTVGPVEPFKEIADAYKAAPCYFRTDEFSALVLNNLKRLATLMGTSTKDGILYFTASGSGAMEAVVCNCLYPAEKVLVINGGSFGKRFCDILRFYDFNFVSVDIEFGTTLTPEILSKYDGQGFTSLFVNLHETSIGLLYDINIISDFCKRNDLYLYVDAISSFLADEYAMDDYGVDATIISSQKGLCLSPGLSFVALSERQIEKCQQIKIKRNMYFDFSSYLANIKRGQTPFTPAVGIMHEMHNMLDLIEKNGGLTPWLQGIAGKSRYFRDKASQKGFKYPSYPLSNMLTPLVFDTISAHKVFELLKIHYGIYVNPCSGKQAERMIRVSHIGNLEEKDFDMLLDALEELVTNHGINPVA